MTMPRSIAYFSAVADFASGKDTPRDLRHANGRYRVIEPLRPSR